MEQTVQKSSKGMDGWWVQKLFYGGLTAIRNIIALHFVVLVFNSNFLLLLVHIGKIAAILNL